MPKSNPKSIRKEPAAEYSYTVIYERLPEGGYNVFVPAIPEICTFGQTMEEAREMAQDAIRCVIESSLKAKEPLPQDITPATERVAVTVP